MEIFLTYLYSICLGLKFSLIPLSHFAALMYRALLYYANQSILYLEHMGQMLQSVKVILEKVIGF